MINSIAEVQYACESFQQADHASVLLKCPCIERCGPHRQNPCLATMPKHAMPGNNESTFIRRKALPDGDLRGVPVSNLLTSSEFFTSSHGQFSLCVRIFSIFSSDISSSVSMALCGVVNVLCTLAVWHECGRDPLPDAQPYEHLRFPVEISSHAVWWYVRVCLSDREVDARLFERGVRVSYEAICTGWRTFG